MTLPASAESLAARRLVLRRFAIGVGLVTILALGYLAIKSLGRETEVPLIETEVLASYEHDDLAFTQGLLYHNGKLYESTGRKGQSTVRIVDFETGVVEKTVSLDEDLFGEGIVIWDDRLIQLTWQDEIILEFDAETLELKEERAYSGEGWGLTHDGRHLILSDGTANLRFLDPETYEEVRRVEVTMDGRRLRDLNELEYANEAIYANIWHKDYVVKISPDSGEVIARIDLDDLIPRSERTRDAVLNGLAYDAENDRWFVTGKLWNKLFIVKFLE